jgi:hypothetical protein
MSASKELSPFQEEFAQRRSLDNSRFRELICMSCLHRIASSPCSNPERFLNAAERAHRRPKKLDHWVVSNRNDS